EFAGVVFTPAARNLIEVFLQRERARKRSTWVPDHVRPRSVERVAVLGAGVMGAGSAQLLAVNGVSVVLKDINEELVAAGMHLVEVVRGRATDDETIATLVEVVRKLGKVPVVVADSPGFLVNRLLFPYLDEAVRLVIDGVQPGPVGTHPLPPSGVPGPDVDR